MNIVQEGYYEVCKELGKKDMTNLIYISQQIVATYKELMLVGNWHS